MRKLKRFGTWLLALVFLMSTWPVMAAETGAVTTPQTAAFTDITADNAVLPYVQYLKGKGILTGYPDGSYHPDAGLTRAEAAVVICRAASITPVAAGASKFKDVYPGHWALAYINAAAQAGYLKGDPSGAFRPEQQLTRAEGLTLLFRLSSSDISQATLPALKDMNNTHWAAKPIAAALAASMAGLSTDRTQFMPDAVFTRINLAQALAILLTEDPSLAKVALPGTLTPITGKITRQKAGESAVTITKATSVNPGDVITSVKGAKAQIDYPDGSSLLIKDDTVITIKAAEGKKYVKLDGSEGIAVDWLNVDIARGTMFGALADSHKKDTSTATGYRVIGSLASLNGDIAIRDYLADTAPVQPWYATAQTKKVRVEVDMPWGVAAIRGTFWGNQVASNGGSTTTVLDGQATVSGSDGQSVPVGPGQTTALTGAGLPPQQPVPAPPAAMQQFGQEGAWLQTTAQNIDLNQGAAPPPPPPATPGPTPPPVQTPPQQPVNTWQTLMQTIENAGGTVNTTPTAPAPSTGRPGGSTDRSGATARADTITTPDTITVYINDATNSSGTLLSGPVTVTVNALPLTATLPPYEVIFTGGSGHFSIPRSEFGILSPGTYTIRISIPGVTNPVPADVVIVGAVSGARVSTSTTGDTVTVYISEATDIYGHLLSGAVAVTASVGSETVYAGPPVTFTEGSGQFPIAKSAFPGTSGTYVLSVNIPGLINPLTIPINLTDSSGAEAEASTDLDIVTVHISNAMDASGTLLSGSVAVTAFVGGAVGYPNTVIFTDGEGEFFIPKSALTEAGTNTIRVIIARVTDAIDVIVDLSGATVSIEEGDIIITEAKDSNGDYLFGPHDVSVFIAEKAVGDTVLRERILVKEQSVTFGEEEEGFVRLNAPGLLLPAIYELEVTIDDVTASIDVAYDSSGAWDYMPAVDSPSGNGMSKVALPVSGRLVAEDGGGIKVWEMAEGTWVETTLSKGDEVVIDGSPQADGGYVAYRTGVEGDEYEEIVITSGFPSSDPDATSLPEYIFAGEYSLNGKGDISIAYGKTDATLGLSLWEDDMWSSDLLNGPPVSGAVDLKSAMDSSGESYIPYVACADGSQVKVYSIGYEYDEYEYFDHVAYRQIGQDGDIPVTVDDLALAFYETYSDDGRSIPYLACTSTTGEITIWEYNWEFNRWQPLGYSWDSDLSIWQPLGDEFSGTEAVLRIAPSGTPYLAFIDDEGTASLYKYAYLGMGGSIPQYGWIGGKVHPHDPDDPDDPDDPYDPNDVSVDLFIEEDGTVVLAYTDGDTAKVAEYYDPLNGVTRETVWDEGGQVYIYGLSTTGMEYLDGVNFLPIIAETLWLPLDSIDPDIGVIVRMRDFPESAVRLLLEFMLPDELYEGEDYSLRQGLEPGTVQLTNLDEDYYYYAVQSASSPVPAYGSSIGGLTPYHEGVSIPVDPGDYILLASSYGDGIEAYAYIPVSDADISMGIGMTTGIPLVVEVNQFTVTAGASSAGSFNIFLFDGAIASYSWPVSVAAGDNPETVAGKIAESMNNDEYIPTRYDITVAGATVTVYSLVPRVNEEVRIYTEYQAGGTGVTMTDPILDITPAAPEVPKLVVDLPEVTAGVIKLYFDDGYPIWLYIPVEDTDNNVSIAGKILAAVDDMDDYYTLTQEDNAIFFAPPEGDSADIDFKALKATDTDIMSVEGYSEILMTDQGEQVRIWGMDISVDELLAEIESYIAPVIPTAVQSYRVLLGNTELQAGDTLVPNLNYRLEVTAGDEVKYYVLTLFAGY